MRIAMLGQKGIPAHSGGVEQHVDILSRALVARGHEVLAYCRRSYLGRDTCSSRDGGLHRIVRCSVATKHLDAITHTLASTIDVMLRRADVVHYHAIGPAALAPLARLAGMPVVVTVHGLDWQRAKWGAFARWCLRAGEWLAARSASQLVVVSPTLRPYFQTGHGVCPRFVPNGVVPLERKPPHRLCRLGLAPGGYLLAVARLVPEKGLHYLLEAFRALPRDVRLAIAGGGGLDDSYERRLRRLADPRVVFLGETSRDLLAELYSHALLFVLPSDVEGMSIALLEAMSVGCPVLVSDIPENAWVVGDAGFTFRSGDAGHLREVLDELMQFPELVSASGGRASARAGAFQWPHIVSQLEAVYRAACGQETVDAVGGGDLASRSDTHDVSAHGRAEPVAVASGPVIPFKSDGAENDS
jgi:glycosyltransferase involved in cell wall biosynthesis